MDALATSLDTSSAPWGGDEPGQAFFGAYSDGAMEVIANASAIPQQLSAIAAALSSTADKYDTTEDANVTLAAGGTDA